VGHRINKRGNQRFLKVKKNENIIYQNFWDTAKAILRGFLYLKERKSSDK
jgi:hypothetical protein